MDVSHSFFRLVPAVHEEVPAFMTDQPPTATCERFTSFDADGSTLIEGLPGHGLVASIAVDRIT